MAKVKHYDFSRRPRKPSKFWMWIARTFGIMPRRVGRPITIEKIRMDGIKPPYLLIATHQSMLDFPIEYAAIAPYDANNVVSLDVFRDVGDYIMHVIGSIPKRRFTKDYHVIRHMRYCIEHNKAIVCVYPESGFGYDGTTGYIPKSLAKMVKLLKVPLVCLRMYGAFVSAPQWNKTEQRIPLRGELECLATAEEIRTLPWQEIDARIQKGMQHDDYRYMLEYGITIPFKNRAYGLHNILYQCPHCGKEFEMDSKGTKLWCNACGKVWNMLETYQLEAEDGNTEFSHIPDWTKWERANVREEVRSGKYRFEADVRVRTLPNAKRFYDQGMGKLVQTCESTHLECTAYGEPVSLTWAGTELDGVHVEYDYPWRKIKYWRNIFGDSVVLSTPDESYWLHPVGLRDRLTKIVFATLEIHFLAMENVRKDRT